MKRSSGPRKTAANLPEFAHSLINSYTLAAGAAGVTLLALTQPAEAEIVFTPANQTIGRNGSLNLDLNHDGIVDFVIKERASSGSTGGFSSRQYLYAKAAPHNQVRCPYAYCLSTFFNAAALRKGSQIDPSQKHHGWLPGAAQMALEERLNQQNYYFESFANVQGLYLGLRFQVKGETHFGWARFSVNFRNGGPNQRTWEAHLTGFAYETVPNQSIKAGQTVEDDADAAVNPDPTRPAQAMALGALALGADGIALWRREVF